MAFEGVGKLDVLVVVSVRVLNCLAALVERFGKAPPGGTVEI